MARRIGPGRVVSPPSRRKPPVRYSSARLTPSGLRAKAELVRLLHGADLAAAAGCIEQRALASLCDDLIAGHDRWASRPLPRASVA